MRILTKRFALPLLIILCAAVATPQFVKPEGSLASSLPWNATVESGHGYNIGWMSKDRGTLFTLFSSTLYATTNDGASWTPVHTFPTSIRAVIDLDNGELLVTSERGPSSLPTMWLSNGYPTQGVDANWLKVLEADSLNTSFYGWGLSTHEQYVVAIPYRGHEVFFSEDTGRTWRKIFKLPPSADGHNAHMHGGAYDPYWDYIWIVNGDDANRALRYSPDHGATWVTVDSGNVMQFVNVLPMENCILFGTDGFPTGIHRIDRTADRSVSPPVPAYVVQATESRPFKWLSGNAFRARGEGMPAIFPFIISIHSNSIAVVTYDGHAFDQVWADSKQYVYPPHPGLWVLVGPTQQGNYFGTLDDNRYYKRFSRLSFLSTPIPWQDTSGVLYEGNRRFLYAFDDSTLRVDTNSFSIGGWLYWNASTESEQHLVAKTSATAGFEWLLKTAPDGRVEMAVYDSAGSASSLKSTAVLQKAGWNHVVGIYNSAQNSLILCVNGTMASGWSAHGSHSGTGEIRFGCSLLARNQVKGVFDDWALWVGRALTQDDVNTLFNSGNGLAWDHWPSSVKKDITAFWPMREVTWVRRDMVGDNDLMEGNGSMQAATGKTKTLELSITESGNDTTSTPLPKTCSLAQNYPNPFNPSTTISYDLSSEARVTLKIYDTLGQQVAVLEDGEQEAGRHSVKFLVTHLASGVYFYRLDVSGLVSSTKYSSRSRTGTFSETRKLMLVR